MRRSRAAPGPLQDELPTGARGGVRALRALAGHLWPRDDPGLRARVVIALACLIAAKLALVAVPYVLKLAVDALPASGTGAALPLGLILAYGTARLAAQMFPQIRDLVFAKVEVRTVRRVALSVFRHLHGLSLRFHLERRTGGLSRAIERGTSAIERLLSLALFNVVPTALELLLVFAVLWGLLGAVFAWLAVAVVVAYTAFTIVITEWRTKFLREMNESDNRANTRAIDSLLNYETVKYFNAERHEAERYDRLFRDYEAASLKSQSTLALLNMGQSAIVAVGLALMMWLAADGIARGELSVGDFVMVNTYLIQLAGPLNMFGWVYREINQAVVDLEKLFGLLDVRAEVTDAKDARPLSVRGGAVRFEEVRFAYDPRRPILQGVTFEVPAGRTVAIVGPSGAGKSTIARLLFRFWDVTGGAITIDGQDLRAVTQESVRRAIGIVPQDTVLFNDTIRYNIGYARPEATQDAIEHAASLAQIDRFVAGLPDRWETMVGERGLKLSGGEKQRVAIARAVLKDPPILIFDEATSALDTHTEKEIQANLAAVSRGRTTLVIAHRLSTVIDADEILVLDQGRIVERGTHGGLLAADGAYAALWRRQLQAQAAGSDAAEAVLPAASLPVAE